MIVTCQVGLRGYLASRILAQKGYKVKNLDGGYKLYKSVSGKSKGMIGKINKLFARIEAKNFLKELLTMNEITVYTTNTCPYCHMVKNFLSEKGMLFKEVNVQQDPAAGQRLVETTGQMGVPQTNVNGQWVLGFDPSRIMSLIHE
ncbi:glutaredoxin and related proteins [Sporolactobacillus inulinus]|uniref:Glutaredoxin and related proteins n=4 Tax=Sporolactobacillus TaxID=2077 RepID=A0A4Y1ZCT0_9BACL|nr:glutaredoxin and related proteins [Sporolactobacillus inulinus]